MKVTSSQVERYLWRFVITIAVVGLLCMAIDWSYWFWAERRLIVTVIYANGQPATGLYVHLERLGDPLDAIPWAKAGPRRWRGGERFGTGRDGSWESLSRTLFGRYNLSVFGSPDHRTLLHLQEAYVSPFNEITHVQVVLDESLTPAKPE